MIGTLERRKGMYKVLLRQIVTFAFIKARCNDGRIALYVIQKKFGQLLPSDVVSYMNEPILKAMFRREIESNGIVYHLTANFRYAEFDTVNKFVDEQLKKAEKKKKK